MDCSVGEGLTKKQVTIILQVMAPTASTAACARGLRASVHRRPHAAAPRSTRAPTLLRLAAPNVLVMVLQAVVTTMDGVFSSAGSGRERSPACPSCIRFVMLMQTMSAGGMGAGSRRPVARALGAGRPPPAQALAGTRAHRVAMAALFTVSCSSAGPLSTGHGGGGRPSRAASPIRTFISAARSSLASEHALEHRARHREHVLPAAVTTGSALLYLGLARPS